MPTAAWDAEHAAELPHESKLWWSAVARGLLGFLFGIGAIGSPKMAMTTLLFLFAGYLVLDGALAAYGAFRSRQTHHRSTIFVVQAGADLAAVIVLIVAPAFAALRLVAGLRNIVVGVCEARGALKPRAVAVPILSIFAGLAAIASGVLLLGWPGPATIALPWLLGIGVWMSGICLAGGALIELTTKAPRHEPMTEAPPAGHGSDATSTT
jgi:uncharacterized membrane protein HdeD (DUF308 family)